MARRQSTQTSSRGTALYEDDNYIVSPAGLQRKTSGEETLTDIVATLYSEHGYIESLLEKLEQESARLKPGKIPDYHLLMEFIDYLTHYPGQYHHPREDLLFGTLLRKDKTFKTKLERLTREHETLGRYNEELYAELHRITRGGRVDRKELLRLVQRYVNAYRLHMKYEGENIFPLAKGKLSSADLEKLERKTRYVDDPVFGGELQQGYQRLRRRLGHISFDLIGRNLTRMESAMEQLSEFMTGLAEARSSTSGKSRRETKGARRRGVPSWQARLMNGFTRVTLKPMMRHGNIDSMRGVMTAMAEQQERMLPEDIRTTTVKNKPYEGEWVKIAGQRSQQVILYFPGGGFVLRTPIQHRGFVARICRTAKARSLIVHYSLAPEVPFPGGLEDCLAAWHDLLAQGIKPGNITIAGDSAGGGLVLSTLLALRDEGGPMPRNAIILSPLGDLTYSGESRKFNKRADPMLPTHRSSEMHQLYIGEAIPEDRFISPVFADFDGLPPILGQVGSTEILLDDTLRAARQAEKAGVPFFLEVWHEMPHVFPLFGFLPESQLAIDRMADFIRDSKTAELPLQWGRAA